MSGIKKDGFQFLRAMIDYIAMAVLSIAMEFSLYFVRDSRFTIHPELTEGQFQKLPFAKQIFQTVIFHKSTLLNVLE